MESRQVIAYLLFFKLGPGPVWRLQLAVPSATGIPQDESVIIHHLLERLRLVVDLEKIIVFEEFRVVMLVGRQSPSFVARVFDIEVTIVVVWVLHTQKPIRFARQIANHVHRTPINFNKGYAFFVFRIWQQRQRRVAVFFSCGDKVSVRFLQKSRAGFLDPQKTHIGSRRKAG